MVYRNVIKRMFDVLFALVGLPFFAILFLCVAPFIKAEDGGTVFYRAKRRGLGGSVFEMYKFRSMKMNAPDLRNKDNSTYNAANDPRVTRSGRFLRKTSLDEVPQLLNVLRGDMSLIGPRPITIDKSLDEYDEKRRVRLTVRPGITGYTQAYYRQSIDQERKFELDAEYAKNVSFLLDAKIFFKTIQTVLLRKNIYNTKNE